MTDIASVKTTSIGSSIVTMWARRVRLMNPSRVAIVVVFPEPVGPVTRISPRRVSASDRITVGSESSSNVRSSGLTHRIASPTVSDSRSTLTRNRPTPSIV